MSEPCRLRRGEGYGVCEDDGAVQRGLGALPPTSRLDLPLTAGGPILHRGSHDALLARFSGPVYPFLWPRLLHPLIPVFLQIDNRQKAQG